MTEGDPMPDNDIQEAGDLEAEAGQRALASEPEVHTAEPVAADPLEEPESFPKEYVLQLRDEAAKYRVRSRWADELGERLHVELVRATGRLADPTDLPYSEEYLQDPEALERAIDSLLQRKPHLASRKPVGEIGQGATPSAGPVDLAGMLRQRAR